jgi:hypothetical protein
MGQPQRTHVQPLLRSGVFGAGCFSSADEAELKEEEDDDDEDDEDEDEDEELDGMTFPLTQ